MARWQICSADGHQARATGRFAYGPRSKVPLVVVICRRAPNIESPESKFQATRLSIGRETEAKAGGGAALVDVEADCVDAGAGRKRRSVGEILRDHAGQDADAEGVREDGQIGVVGSRIACSASSRSCLMAIRSRRLRPGSSPISRSRSLSARASPRAREPKTRTVSAP